MYSLQKKVRIKMFLSFIEVYKMKRILATICIFFLLLPQFAAEAENPELVTNGNLEIWKNGVPLEWGGTTLDWGKNSVEISTEKPHSEKYGCKITNDGSDSPWISQQVGFLIPGATYRISFFLNAELGAHAEKGAGVYLVFYRGLSASSGSVGSRFVMRYASTNGRWTEMTDEFVLPVDATMVKIYCRLFSDGVAYFDDISLKLYDIEKFSSETSHVFHYTDEESGTAKVNLHSYYRDSGIAEKYKVNFTILDGERKVHEKTGVLFSGLTAAHTYPTSVLTEKKKKYSLRIAVVDMQGTEEKVFISSLYKYDRPEYLDEDGFYRDENGTIINPMIAFHLDHIDHPKAVEAGYNMFQIGYGATPLKNTEEREAMLMAMDASGLKGIWCLYLGMKAAAHPDNIENTKKLVEMYKDDPRIFAWAVQDEPLGGRNTEEAKALLELSYKTIRDIDSKHPIILTDFTSSVFSDTLKYCDAFIPNSYGRTCESVALDTKAAVEAANGKPVYVNVSTYSRTTTDELPTKKQMQHAMYQALCEGARGISTYSFSDSVPKPARTAVYNTPLWDTLCDMGTRQLPTAFSLFVHGGAYVDSTTNKAVQRKWEKADGTYYFLLSKTDEKQTFAYSVQDAEKVKIHAGDPFRNFTKQGNTLTVSLEGGDVLLFKIGKEDGRVQIRQNGIEIDAATVGTAEAISREGSQTVLAVYEKKNGINRLKKFSVANSVNQTASLPITEEDRGLSLKAFAFEKSMIPTGKATEYVIR